MEQLSRTQEPTFEQQKPHNFGIREAVTAVSCAVALIGAERSTDVARAQAPQTPSLTGGDAESRAEVCETKGTARPSSISGRYLSYKPNNHLYSFSTSLKKIEGCDTEGKRRITIYHSLYTTDAITGETGLFPAGEKDIIKAGNKASKINRTIRAVHWCWGSGSTAKHKREKTVGKPTVNVTWTPKSGKPTTKTYYGAPAKVCK